VNLPRALKMTTPRYQDVPAARIPEVTAPGGARVRVVAGSVDGVEGAVREIFAGPSYLDVALPAGTSFEQPIPRGHTALAYVFRGRIEVAGKEVAARRLAILGDGDRVRVRAPAGDARFLLLSAQPLEEPAVRYGPFVMNTEDEIRQALWDLRNGTFVKTRPAGAR
jgi:redox-sensitive bicupin YhaK (pirin superfamily)